MGKRVVWKYPLALTSATQQVTMPAGARVVHVQVQGSEPTLWAEVDPEESRTMLRLFRVVATGVPVPAFFDHRGTIHLDWTVWHIYEGRP